MRGLVAPPRAARRAPPRRADGRRGHGRRPRRATGCRPALDPGRVIDAGATSRPARRPASVHRRRDRSRSATRPRGSTGSRARALRRRRTRRARSRVLFAGREPVAAIARGGLEVAPTARTGPRSSSPGCGSTVDEPLRAWTRRLRRRRGRVRADASRRSAPPAELDAADPVAQRRRDERLRAARAACAAPCAPAGASATCRCLGQRGHAWGEPDWEPHRARRARSAPGSTTAPALTLSRGAPGRRDGHADEARLGRRCSTSRARARTSTTRGCRRPTTPTAASAAPASSCGSSDDEPARDRAAGEVLCGSTLDLGALRLDCAFFRWRIEGRSGVGPLRRPAARLSARALASSRSRAGPSSRARGTRPRAPSQRSADSHGSTVSSACSSATPASNASSPRKPAAIFSASRRFSPSAGNAPTQELLVGDRHADLQRGVPRGEHRQVVLVEVGDRLGVVRRELLLRDLVHPRAHQLAEQLPARLAADGLGDHADGVLRLDEAERHAAEGTATGGRNRRRSRTLRDRTRSVAGRRP